MPAKTETLPAAPPKHNSFNTRLALEAGISQSEIDGYSPDALEAVLHREWRARKADREQVTNRDVRANEPSGVPVEFVDPKTSPPPAFDDGLTDDNSTPEIRAALSKRYDALKADFDKRLADLESSHKEVRGHVEQQVYMTRQQQSDKWFSDHSDQFGKGIRADLSDDSADLQRRVAFDKLAAGMSKKGDTIASAYDRAHRVVYGEAPKPAPVAPVVAGPTAREREWQAGGVARPTQQAPGEEPKGRTRAIKKVEEIRRAQNDQSLNGSAEYAELPD